MEKRKQKEIEYYDKKARDSFLKGDFEPFNLFLLESYKFLKDFLKDKCRGKVILDYGCGNGVHSVWLSQYGGKVIGIDLSQKSLETARKRFELNNADFLLMDCEKLEFPDNYFDIVFDGAVFSSLDINKAFSEIARVLKPDGFLIGIETFGHNPLANFKRAINKITGKRTKWAVSHILKQKDLKQAEKYFKKQKIYYFHAVSFLAFPFLNSSFGKLLLMVLERIDKILLKSPFFKRGAFKIVFILKKHEKII